MGRHRQGSNFAEVIIKLDIKISVNKKPRSRSALPHGLLGKQGGRSNVTLRWGRPERLFAKRLRETE